MQSTFTETLVLCVVLSACNQSAPDCTAHSPFHNLIQCYEKLCGTYWSDSKILNGTGQEDLAYLDEMTTPARAGSSNGKVRGWP
jgi:hypothetical protein